MEFPIIFCLNEDLLLYIQGVEKTIQKIEAKLTKLHIYNDSTYNNDMLYQLKYNLRPQSTDKRLLKSEQRQSQAAEKLIEILSHL